MLKYLFAVALGTFLSTEILQFLKKIENKLVTNASITTQKTSRQHDVR